MHIIGLDLSINYPALCISENFETFEFVGFINDPRISNVSLQYVLTESAKYDGVTLTHIAEPRKTCETYHQNERRKLLLFNHITSALSIAVRSMLGTVDDDVIVAMEGISYGSKGSALVDICMLTGMVRRMLLTDVLRNDSNRMFVFAPSELKNAIGLKGNATKTEVLAQFMDDPGIEPVRGCGMYAFMRDHVPSHDGSARSVSEYVYNTKRDEVESPFNDMIDAYLSVLKIRRGMS